MILSIIVAVSENNAIGRSNQLPWHLPADLKFFKQTTIGKPVLMGRKTYEALGKPLPGRPNIVLTSHGNGLPEEVMICSTLEEGITMLEQTGADEGFIIGGGKVFADAIDKVDKLYITRIHTSVNDADAFFPEIDHTHWKLTHATEHGVDEKHQFPFTFQQFERTEL